MDYRGFYLELHRRMQREALVPVTTYLTGARRGEKEFKTEQVNGCFSENFQGQMTVVLCGAGHVSQAAARIFRELEYRLIVVDDRLEYANTVRFPMADEIRCLNFDTEFPNARFPEHAYYVILTRGHEHDYTCLRNILTRSHGYIGMIGSRSKVKLSRERLAEEGFSAEQVDAVHAPIGLRIGGQTPAEIAVSIAAEIIQVKNTESGSTLDEAVLEGLNQTEPSVMVTVTEKEGSSPRGKGSRMVVTSCGKNYGTIGGGAIEYAAVKRAVELCRTGCFDTAGYDLGNSEAATLGMVCGGRVAVMFEPL
ncbi:XdhC family protein [Ruminococcus sp. OA3]|uniref:XdhC family protein n=1 Tax=Ruminococcus sp. OA3 TaxID=2914164 RepID=UPI001F05A8E1|nr:XdhC family protein [Ruminococcus sp. OA3]MCH1982582.1 XdhC family protein [Ruminococcus sp. OA3]